MLKTSFVRGANAGLKLFLNICTHEMVEKPHIQSIVPEGQTEPEEAMRIPVSVGPPIEDFDKKKVATVLLFTPNFTFTSFDVF